MDIIMERGKVVPLKSLPPYSIAVDGACQGPEIDSENNRYSFDHHAGCLRFCTSAACIQTLDAILLGLDPTKYTIFINDVDMDTVMSIWCLKNPERCVEPKVRQLVDAIGKQDMHAGAYPLNGLSKVVEWISAPQTDSVRNGDYYKLSDNGLLTIMESMIHRIDKYINGEAMNDIAAIEPHGEFEIKKNDNGWILVESHDPHAYSALYQANFTRIVLVIRLEDGSLAVSIAKKSDFIENFPNEKIYANLNKLEPGWGGSSSIGGAPRNSDGSRSRLPLDTIVEVVNRSINGESIADLISSKKIAKKKAVKKKTTRRSGKTIPPKD